MLLLASTLCAAEAPRQGEVQVLIQKYGCLSCHGMTRAQVGPGFAQIAARYRDDPAAASQLPRKIVAGGVGAWGRVIMPRQRGMTDSDARLLADWVLSQPSPP